MRGCKSGFTLVELLVAICIMAILAMWAVPSFGTMLAKNKFNQFTREYAQLLVQARSQAILTKNPTVVCVGKDNDNGMVDIDTCVDLAFPSLDTTEKNAVKNNNRVFVMDVPESVTVLNTPANIPVYFSALGAVFANSNANPSQRNTVFCSNEVQATITASRMGNISINKGVCS